MSLFGPFERLMVVKKEFLDTQFFRCIGMSGHVYRTAHTADGHLSGIKIIPT